MTPAPPVRRMLLRGAALAVLVAAVLAARAVLIDDGPRARHGAQRVTLMSPPKPTPPPKREEPPPEQVQEDVRVAEAPKDPAEALPDAVDDNLGVDADGSGAGDGFGLVGKKGGRDLVTLGKPSGDGAAAPVDPMRRFGGYAAVIARHLERELSRQDGLRTANYQTVVRLWLGRDGSIRRAELDRSTGDPTMDERIRATLGGFGGLLEPPPEDMPQPIRLRLTSRGAST